MELAPLPRPTPPVNGSVTITARITLILAATALFSGCGLGMLQTARTTPAGELDFFLAAGYLHNEMIEVRDFGLTNLPVNFGVRYGVTDNLDIGATLFMGAGVVPDVKYNFLPPDCQLAVSLQAGFGAAHDVFAGNDLARALGWTQPTSRLRLCRNVDVVCQGREIPCGSPAF